MKLLFKNSTYLIIFFSLFIFSIEILFTLLYTINQGEYISISKLLMHESSSSMITGNEVDCAFEDTTVPHPFLSYIHKNIPECYLTLNNIGLDGIDFPYKYIKENFTILLTGGSVANDVISSLPDYLLNRLNSLYIPPNGKKRFVILTGGVGGWYQPRQFILFSMYANILDGIITLDGYNEHLNISNEILRLENPTSFFSYHTNYNIKLITQAYLKIHNFFKNNYFTSRSYFLYFVGSRIRKIIKQLLILPLYNNNKTKNVINQYLSNPEHLDRQTNLNSNREIYKNYIRNMHYIAQGLKLKEAYFLQPHPHIMKTLTKEEREKAVIMANPKDYITLVNQLIELKKENLPIFSLLNIFKDVKKTIYSDHIHCETDYNNSTSLGYKMIINKIIDQIGKNWNLKKR